MFRFRIYMESGKLINLHDWFQGFASFFSEDDDISQKHLMYVLLASCCLLFSFFLKMVHYFFVSSFYCVCWNAMYFFLCVGAVIVYCWAVVTSLIFDMLLLCDHVLMCMF